MTVLLRRRSFSGFVRRLVFFPGTIVTVDAGVQLEGLSSLSVDALVPVEHITNLVADSTVRLEALASLILDSSAFLESLSALVQDAVIPFEDTGSLSVTVDVSVPLEALARWTADSLLPIEFAGSVAVTAFGCVHTSSFAASAVFLAPDAALTRVGPSDAALATSSRGDVAIAVMLMTASQIHASLPAATVSSALTWSDAGRHAVLTSEFACTG